MGVGTPSTSSDGSQTPEDSGSASTTSTRENAAWKRTPCTVATVRMVVPARLLALERQPGLVRESSSSRPVKASRPITSNRPSLNQIERTSAAGSASAIFSARNPLRVR